MDIDKDLKDEVGIVLSSVDFKETSKIIRVLTENNGLLSIMVQGAKKSNSKNRNLAENFVKGSFNLSSGKNMYYLKDGSILNMNLGLRKNIKKIYLAYFFSDLVLRSVLENEKQREIFILLDNSLQKLSESNELIKLSTSFIFKLVSFLGYRPNLSMCSNCGTRKFTRMYFSSKNGGILCNECKSMDIDRVELTKEEYRYIVDLIYSPIDDIEKINGVNEIKIHKLSLNFYLTSTENYNLKSQKPLKDLGMI